MALKKTRQEKASEEMQARLERFCKDEYPQYSDTNEYEPMELHFVADMSPHEIWRADFEPVGENEEEDGGDDKEKTESVYLVWNGREVIGHDDDAESALLDVLTEQKEIRVRQRMAFVASPLIVSGVLAIGLLLLIAYLSIRTTREIPQLWTIFTAVIAFYFGKQGGAAAHRDDTPGS